MLPGFKILTGKDKGRVESIEETPIDVPENFTAVHTWDRGRPTRFSSEDKEEHDELKGV